jgi:hypothetical protein
VRVAAVHIGGEGLALALREGLEERHHGEAEALLVDDGPGGIDVEAPVDVALGVPLLPLRLGVEAAQLVDLDVVVELPADLHGALEDVGLLPAVVAARALLLRCVGTHPRSSRT